VIVVDASVLANAVGDDEAAGQLARARHAAASAVSAPDLVDVETVCVLRRRWLAGDLSDERFGGAVDDLLALPIIRFPVGPMMVRAFELRANITAYGACYVALAEVLDCSLITADRRLANARLRPARPKFFSSDVAAGAPREMCVEVE
jgi:predicted nucleic acid-binding protein